MGIPIFNNSIIHSTRDQEEIFQEFTIREAFLDETSLILANDESIDVYESQNFQVWAFREDASNISDKNSQLIREYEELHIRARLEEKIWLEKELSFNAEIKFKNFFANWWWRSAFLRSFKKLDTDNDHEIRMPFQK